MASKGLTYHTARAQSTEEQSGARMRPANVRITGDLDRTNWRALLASVKNRNQFQPFALDRVGDDEWSPGHDECLVPPGNSPSHFITRVHRVSCG
jgi:hypothetical protein